MVGGHIYQRFSGEADHEHTSPVAGADIHILRRGNKYSAAAVVRGILAADDRPRTMHAETERTPRELLPDIVAHCSSATINAAPPAAKPGANTSPPTAHAKPPMSGSRSG